MKKRKDLRPRQRVPAKRGQQKFTPLTAKEIGALGGRGNELVIEPHEYPLIRRMAMYLPEKFIAGVLGISHDTFQRMKARDPKLLQNLEKGVAEGGALVGQTLLQLATSKTSPGATIFYAKTRLGMKETMTLETKNAPTSDPEVNQALGQLSAEDLRAIADILRRARDARDAKRRGKAAGGEEPSRVH